MLAVFTVDTDQDVVDDADGLSSLREAIVAANTQPGPDEIVFDLGHEGPAMIQLELGELEHHGSVDDHRSRPRSVDDRRATQLADLQHHGGRGRLCHGRNGVDQWTDNVWRRRLAVAVVWHVATQPYFNNQQ